MTELKIDKKKIATILKTEDAENRVMRIAMEDTTLVIEYLSGWTEIKDLKGSVTKSAGMLIDYIRESKREINGLILRCTGENLTTQINCLLSKEDIERWLDYDFGVDEFTARIQ
ncbi:MAG: hypothetical protein JW737_05360 [Acidobacteria bacterium]|nr:hypothetical protein [Acidobacteriota bacterium]